MAIQLTREQYRERYGLNPVDASKSELDTTPAPLQMTRAEYNALYRPQLTDQTPSGFVATVKDIPSDLKESVQSFGQSLEQGRQTGVEARQQVEAGEISPQAGTIKTLGGAAKGGVGAIFNPLLNLLKLPFSPATEQKILNTASQGGSFAVREFKKSFDQELNTLKASEDPTDQQVAQDIDMMLLGYETDPEVKAVIDGYGGIVEAVAEFFTLKGSTRATGEIVDVAGDLSRRTQSELKNIEVRIPFRSGVEKAEQQLFDIENQYTQTRKVIDASADSGVNSRKRIASSGVLNNAVDENGVIRTTVRGGPVDAYKAQTVDGVEDIVRKLLAKEGQKSNLAEVRAYLKTEVASSGLEGSDLVRAINGLERELEGLSLRADEFGNIPLQNLQDAKISTTANINYLRDANPTINFRKAKARAYKKIIEDKSNANIKEVNSALAKYYEDIDRLRRLDGKRVKGGKLGRYFASVGGQVVGGAAGSIAGGPGAGLGAILGGELAARLQTQSMRRTFGNVRGDIQKNPVLERAKAEAATGDIDLRTPDIVVGVPKGLKQSAETRLLERQIADNVRAQKKAIKAGDFALVVTLKDIYNTLVDRLKATIAKLNDVAEEKGIGLSIRRSVTPKSVAKNMDNEDRANFAAIIDDVENARTNPDINRMLEEMDLQNANNDELVSFAREAIDEYEGVAQREVLNSNQAQANTTPTTVQNIDNNSTDTFTGSQTPSTNLLEEAKKYKSAEEFITNQKVYYHGTTEKAKSSINKSGFKPGKVEGELGKAVYITDDITPAKLFDEKLEPLEIYTENLNTYELPNFKANPDVEARKLAELIIEKDALPELLKGADVDFMVKRIKDTWSDSANYWLEMAGYDGVTDATSQIRGQIAVFDPSKIKTRTQLEDIWKQANQ